jgi:hypothetical protein
MLRSRGIMVCQQQCNRQLMFLKFIYLVVTSQLQG